MLIEDSIDNETHEVTQQADTQSASAHVALELDACKVQLKDLQQKYSYLGADFENYKRRMIADRALYATTANVELLRKLLPVIDGLERACVACVDAQVSEEVRSWAAGITLVYQSFQQFLRDVGVQEITTTTGFDPELHEALSRVQTDAVPSGHIVDVLQKGYTYKGTVLRHTLVSVAQ